KQSLAFLFSSKLNNSPPRTFFNLRPKKQILFGKRMEGYVFIIDAKAPLYNSRHVDKTFF
ncbi:MAG: hypothetical protein LUG62_09265, partial [Clostridiales bacterium]|nr:hypothetical protein [Clostridiales bacterium]